MHKYFIGLLLLSLYGCAAMLPKIQAPEVHVADLRLAKLALFEQTFELKLRIRNPNDIDIPLDGFAYTLYLNDKRVAAGTSDAAVLLTAGQSTLVSTTMRSSLLDIVGQLGDLNSVLGKQAEYRVSGVVRLQGRARDFKFEHDGLIDLRQLKNAKWIR